MTPAPGRATVAAAAVVLALPLLGCGLLVDSAYLLGDGHYRDSAEESAPTGETARRLEAEVTPDPDGALRLGCTARTRSIERSWQVQRTYQRQGGFEADTYTATAVLDGVVGAVVAGVLLGFCTHEDSDLSCWNMLYASPFALDLGYSLIRRATARPAVLVDKSRSRDRLRHGAEPLAEQPTSCDWVSSLWVGGATGPSDEAFLNGEGEGAARHLGPGAVEVPLGPDGQVILHGEAAASWAGQSWAGLWAIDHQGVPHQVRVDRCGALRPHAAGLSEAALQSFQNDCPLPQPPSTR
jgi:hypothetical protein